MHPVMRRHVSFNVVSTTLLCVERAQTGQQYSATGRQCCRRRPHGVGARAPVRTMQLPEEVVSGGEFCFVDGRVRRSRYMAHYCYCTYYGGGDSQNGNNLTTTPYLATPSRQIRYYLRTRFPESPHRISCRILMLRSRILITHHVYDVPESSIMDLETSRDKT